MIGGIAFGNDPVHPSKTVNEEIVGAPALHVFQQRFAKPLKEAILACCEGRLPALRSVEHDARWFGTDDRRFPIRLADWKSAVRARMIANGQAIVNPQAIAVGLGSRALLDYPNVIRLRDRGLGVARGGRCR